MRYIVGSYVVSSPALGSDANGNTIIYIGCDDGNLYALSSSGTLLWKFSAGAGGVVSSPAIGTDGTIYVGSVNGDLYAVNPNGTQKWAYATGDIVNYRPRWAPTARSTSAPGQVICTP